MDFKRKGHPRDTGNIGHKTQIENKQNKKYNTEILVEGRTLATVYLYISIATRKQDYLFLVSRAISLNYFFKFLNLRNK
jgi:hypothetical protein